MVRFRRQTVVKELVVVLVSKVFERVKGMMGRIYRTIATVMFD